MLTAEGEVAGEFRDVFEFNVLTLSIEVVSTQAEIYESNVRELRSARAVFLLLAHNDVVHLEVVVDFADAVEFFQDLEEAVSYLAYRLQRKLLISLC